MISTHRSVRLPIVSFPSVDRRCQPSPSTSPPIIVVLNRRHRKSDFRFANYTCSTTIRDRPSQDAWRKRPSPGCTRARQRVSSAGLAKNLTRTREEIQVSVLCSRLQQERAQKQTRTVSYVFQYTFIRGSSCTWLFRLQCWLVVPHVTQKCRCAKTFFSSHAFADGNPLQTQRSGLSSA